MLTPTRTIAALGVFVAAISLGCSSGTSDEGSSSSSNQALTANERTAYEFFVSKGLTNFQAAGIVGNLIQESNVDPGAVQSGGPGRGIAQWSAGGRWDTDGGDNLRAFVGCLTSITNSH